MVSRRTYSTIRKKQASDEDPRDYYFTGEDCYSRPPEKFPKKETSPKKVLFMLNSEYPADELYSFNQ